MIQVTTSMKCVTKKEVPAYISKCTTIGRYPTPVLRGTNRGEEHGPDSQTDLHLNIVLPRNNYVALVKFRNLNGLYTVFTGLLRGLYEIHVKEIIAM